MAINDGDILGKLLEDARILGEARMLRDEQPVTEDLAKAVVERFHQFLHRREKSAEWAARSMAISPSTLSQVTSGSYAADAEKHLRTIDKWLEQQIMREAAPKPPGFVKTTVAEHIYAVVSWAMKTNSIAMIYGPSGSGKTTTVQAIRAETPGSIFSSIDSSAKTSLAVLQGVAHALRITGLRLSGSQLFKQLSGLLKDTGRLIIIDEVHKLAGRRNDDALHVLRDLHDATGCPMVWAGNGKIAKYIRDGHTEGHDPLDQIYGRISYWLDLTEIARGNGDGNGDGGTRLFTTEDIRKVFAASKIRLAPDAERYLMLLANDPSQGCLRAAKNLVGIASVYARGGVITGELLRAVQRERLSRQSADVVESQITELAKQMARVSA